MRKFLLTILITVTVLALISGAVIYFWLQPIPIERVLPAGPVSYVHFSNTKKTLEEIQKTALWRNIASIDYKRLMKELDVPPQQQGFVQLGFTVLSDPKTAEVIEKLFGQEFAFGLYSENFDLAKLKLSPALGMAPLLEDLFSGMFLVTRVSRDIQLAEFVSGLLQQPRGRVSMDVVEYEGHKINLVDVGLGETKLAFVRFKDLFVISLGEKPAKKSIDVVKGKAAGLKQDRPFQKAQGYSLKDKSFLGYFSAESLFQLIGEMIKTAAESTSPSADEGNEAEARALPQQQYDQFMKSVAGFRTLSLSAAWKSPFQMKFDFIFDRDKLDPMIAKMYEACTPIENETIGFVPKDTLVYQWSYCFDLQYLWESMQKELAKLPEGQGGAAQEQIQQVEATMGLSITGDIIPAFGKEIGGFLSDIEMTEFFPVPRFVFFVKVGDRAKMDQLINKVFAAQSFFVFGQEDYAGIPVYSMPLPIGGDLEPAYAFLGDYWLFTVHRTLIEQAIDAQKENKPSLLMNEDFQSVNQGLTDPNTGVQFIQVSGLIKRIRAIVDWANSFADKEDAKREAFKAGAKHRFEDVRAQFSADRRALEKIEEKLNYYKKGINDLTAQGLDASESQKELSKAEEEFRTKEKEIEDRGEEIKELEEVLKGYEDQLLDKRTRQFFVRHVIYPILDGLEVTRGLGARTTMKEDAVETMVFVK